MGKTRDTGFLTDCVFTDSSNNVGIGAAASGSYKLQVTGTSNFTSTINGAGVSLSDTLNGTTANFTSSVTGNFFIASPVATAAQSGGLRLNSQVAINARNAANSADITLITTNSSDGVAIRNGALTIASTGAATFSSIVGVNGASEAGWSLKSNGNAKVEGTNGTTVLQVNDTSTGGKAWSLISAGAGNSHSVPAGTFYLRNSSDGITALSVASGGNVGIGTSSPTQKLTIGGTTDAYMNFAPTSFRNFIIGSDTLGFIVYDNNASAYRMVLNSSGNLGIGTSSPSERLHIVGDAFAGIRINDGTNTALLQWHVSDGFRMVTATSKPIVFFTNDTERMRIGSNGNVGIGQVNASDVRLFVRSAGAGAGTYNIYSRDSNNVDLFVIRDDGYGYLKANAWAYGSDRRIKENIIYIESGLDKVLALKPATFDYINGVKNNIGWIAQDVQEVIPEAVNPISERNDQLTLKSDFIVPYLVKAIQELNAKVSALENKS